MNIEQTRNLERRAALHAALADPARLRIVDRLTIGDAAPSELAEMLSMPSNLLAHHLNVLSEHGVVTRTRSEGDRRRSYVQLARHTLDELSEPATWPARRILFVCTANTARSHLAAALWRRASTVPVASAGTHPADRIDARAIAAAERYELPLRRLRPRAIDEVIVPGDLVVTVCDLAHEELAGRADIHWSVPDPVLIGTDAAFDEALDHLNERIEHLAPSLVSS